MYLKKVIVDNFRIFKGRHVFEFGYGIEHNLNIVFGSNSTGKSSLINAIYWCLFNSELFPNLSEPLYNYEYALNEGIEDIPVSVECHFVDGEDIIKINRKFAFSNNGEKYNLENSHLNITIDDGSKISSVDDYWLFHSFPKDLIDFLIFPSKSHISFFERDYDFVLRDRFYSCFQLEHIENTILHLKKFFRTLRKENYSEFYNVVQYQRELDDLRKRHDEISHSLHEIDDLIMNNKRLIEYHIKEVHLLSPDFKEMQNIKKEIDSQEKKILKLEKEYHKLLFKISPIALIFDKFIQSNNSVKNEKLKNDVLETPNFLHSRLYYSYFNIPNVLNELNGIDDIKNIKYDILNHKSHLMELSERLSLIQNVIDNIESDGHAKTCLKKIKELENQQNHFLSKKCFLKDEKEYLEKKIHRLSKLLDKLEHERPLFEAHNSKLKLCSDAISLGNDLKTKVMENVLLNFNESFNTRFIKKFKMSSKFMQVNVGYDFKIQLVNNYNKIINPEDLSHSDKLMLIIAFLITIQECFEIDYPIILMDPFVYLDEENRNNVIKELVGSKSINQIILILNESQYGDNVKIRLFKKIASEFELKNGSAGFEVVKNGL